MPQHYEIIRSFVYSEHSNRNQLLHKYLENLENDSDCIQELKTTDSSLTTDHCYQRPINKLQTRCLAAHVQTPSHRLTVKGYNNSHHQTPL